MRLFARTATASERIRDRRRSQVERQVSAKHRFVGSTPTVVSRFGEFNSRLGLHLCYVVAVDTAGKHLLMEYWGCEVTVLGDVERIERVMREAALVIGATIVRCFFHKFDPSDGEQIAGVTGVVGVEESHLSIHTWPEKGYASVDVFVCGEKCKPHKALPVIKKGLGAGHQETLIVERGRGSTRNMRIDFAY